MGKCLLLLLLLLLLLSGCATCDMRTDYPSESAVPLTGNVRLAWRFDAEQRVGSYGNTDCTTGEDRLCVIRLKGPPPSFGDVCALAKFGHEMRHVVEVTPSH